VVWLGRNLVIHMEGRGQQGQPNPIRAIHRKVKADLDAGRRRGEGFQTGQLELGDVLVDDGSADRLAVAGDRLECSAPWFMFGRG
jgi:hypothetical protein